LALVDTSAWIEYFRRTESVVHRRLRELIVSDGSIAVSQPILMELLAGARDDADEARMRTLTGPFDLLPFDPDIDFEAAALIKRRCRARGLTVASVDCMIGSVAIRYEAAVLSADLDFARIASVVPLELDPATPRD